MTLDECLKETERKLGITENSSHEDKLICLMTATKGGVVEYPIIENSSRDELVNKFNSELLSIVEKFENSLPDVDQIGFDKYIEIRELKIKEFWQQVKDESIRIILDEMKKQACEFIGKSFNSSHVVSTKQYKTNKVGD